MVLSANVQALLASNQARPGSLFASGFLSQREVPMMDALAWILQGNTSSLERYGSDLLRLLRETCGMKPTAERPIVTREVRLVGVGVIDLVIAWRNEVIYVEGKTKSGEGNGQLQKYCEYVGLYSGRNAEPYFLYLTKPGMSMPIDAKSSPILRNKAWHGLAWRAIAIALGSKIQESQKLAEEVPPGVFEFWWGTTEFDSSNRANALMKARQEIVAAENLRMEMAKYLHVNLEHLVYCQDDDDRAKAVLYIPKENLLDLSNEEKYECWPALVYEDEKQPWVEGPWRKYGGSWYLPMKPVLGQSLAQYVEEIRFGVERVIKKPLKMKNISDDDNNALSTSFLSLLDTCKGSRLWQELYTSTIRDGVSDEFAKRGIPAELNNCFAGTNFSVILNSWWSADAWHVGWSIQYDEAAIGVFANFPKKRSIRKIEDKSYDEITVSFSATVFSDASMTDALKKQVKNVKNVIEQITKKTQEIISLDESMMMLELSERINASIVTCWENIIDSSAAFRVLDELRQALIDSVLERKGLEDVDAGVS